MCQTPAEATAVPGSQLRCSSLWGHVFSLLRDNSRPTHALNVLLPTPALEQTLFNFNIREDSMAPLHKPQLLFDVCFVVFL